MPWVNAPVHRLRVCCVRVRVRSWVVNTFVNVYSSGFGLLPVLVDARCEWQSDKKLVLHRTAQGPVQGLVASGSAAPILHRPLQNRYKYTTTTVRYDLNGHFPCTVVLNATSLLNPVTILHHASLFTDREVKHELIHHRFYYPASCYLSIQVNHDPNLCFQRHLTRSEMCSFLKSPPAVCLKGLH